MSTREQVVLCSDDGTATGVADKRTVHGPDTPLHLAFSCYVFDRHGRFLVTRRARTKLTWPGVRTNSCCGHPGPGEPLPDAVHRRLHQELGITAATLDLVVPGFRYRCAEDGIVENELCPIYRATLADARLAPDPAEVESAWWEPWSTFSADRDPADPLSPWSLLQLEDLKDLGDDPSAWPVADGELLPGAARG